MTACVPRVDLCIPKGSDWAHDFIWQSEGVAVDLTGYSARMQIIDASTAAVIADLSTSGGGLAITAVEGKTTATIDYATTRAITQTRGLYSLLLSSGAGVRTMLAEGTVTFNEAETVDVSA